MQQALRETVLVSVDDYLDSEEQHEGRSEYVDGVIDGMSGGSDRHNLIAGDLFGLLLDHLSDPSQIFVNDMKLLIRNNTSTMFYYPDIMVSCEPGDRDPRWREKPSVVIEVLSPSTERIDRTEKLITDSRVDSLEEYVLVSQEQMHAELYRRANGWLREELGADDTLTLPAIDFSAPITRLTGGLRSDVPAGSWRDGVRSPPHRQRH
jgi:Uma2 family endonuclease